MNLNPYLEFIKILNQVYEEIDSLLELLIKPQYFLQT